MRIMAFGAHPDDIEIGMGGTLAKYSRNDHDVTMVVATIPNNRAVRKNEAKTAARVLGANLDILDIDPEKMIFSRELVRILDEVIRDYSPDVVYTHWDHDSHQDHIFLSKATIASTRKNDCSLYMYEQTIPGGIVPSGFNTQAFVDISEDIVIKKDSIMAHKSQVGLNGEWWIYGIEGRAMYHGYQINVKYAEAFEVVKEIKLI